jgi:DNA invertase Pin-like site-specific DNA recombinase
MRAAIYLRVSTEDQSTANQRPQVEAAARQRGFTEITFVEEVASGAKVRPALRALLDDACRGRYQAIFVWALDRLGRSAWEIAEIVRRLDTAGVRLVSCQDSWLDTAGPARSLLISIFAWVAEFERGRLVERTLIGLEAARKKGRRGGRPRKLTPLAVAKAIDLLQNGVSVVDAARAGNISRQTLYRALKAAGGVVPKTPPK